MSVYSERPSLQVRESSPSLSIVLLTSMTSKFHTPQRCSSVGTDSAKPVPSSALSRVPLLNKKLNPPSAQDEALVEALQASQAANEALEAVIRMQAEALENILRQNKKLCQQLNEAHPEAHPKPVMCEVSTQVLPEEAAENTATPVRPRKRSQSQVPNGSPTVQAPSDLNIDKVAHDNASPYVAEAFRLGWLAGVKSNSLAATKSPSSTRSDHSQPSDPGSLPSDQGSYVMGSRCSSESSNVNSPGSESPPGPSDKLPLLPPPEPPSLLVPPPQVHLEQLG